MRPPALRPGGRAGLGGIRDADPLQALPLALGLVPGRRREPPAHDVLRDRAREKKVLEVALSPGLGPAARHPEAAEGVALDDGPGDAPVQVEVADPVFPAGPLE